MISSIKSRILLTGAGGAAIPFLISHLKKQNYEVFTADMNSNAAGLFLADKGFVIPPGNSLDFFDEIWRLCNKFHIEAIIPLVDEELIKCIDLEQKGIKVILPAKNFIEICLDKYQLMRQLQNHDISVPKTQLASEELKDISFPLILKPRSGRGSRNVYLVKSESHFKEILSTKNLILEEFIFQEYLQGKEFTVSVVIWRNGKVQAVVPKEILDKDGITRRAVTRKIEAIDKICHQIQAKLRPNGPFNVQLCIESNEGKPKIFEINPRFSTSTTLTIMSGVDEIGLLLDQALEKNNDQTAISWQENLMLVRAMSDQFFLENDFLKRLPFHCSELK